MSPRVLLVSPCAVDLGLNIFVGFFALVFDQVSGLLHLLVSGANCRGGFLLKPFFVLEPEE